MYEHPPQPTTEDLQQAVREQCLRRAELLHKRMGEAINCLQNRNHLGALGALTGLEERLRELLTALQLIHDLSYRHPSRTPNSENR